MASPVGLEPRKGAGRDSCEDAARGGGRRGRQHESRTASRGPGAEVRKGPTARTPGARVGLAPGLPRGWRRVLRSDGLRRRSRKGESGLRTVAPVETAEDPRRRKLETPEESCEDPVTRNRTPEIPVQGIADAADCGWLEEQGGVSVESAGDGGRTVGSVTARDGSCWRRLCYSETSRSLDDLSTYECLSVGFFGTPS